MSQLIGTVVTHHMHASLQRKAAGDPGWWCLREASLAALATQISNPLSSPEHHLALDTTSILSSLLEHDLRPSGTPPFLRGRALWLAAKLVAASMPHTRKGSVCEAPADAQKTASLFLRPAVECLGSGSDMPVRVCACRALSLLLPRVPPSDAQALLPPAYDALVQLMGSADQDVLNLVLCTLHDMVRAWPEAAHLHAAKVCTATLSAFPSFANDAQLLDTLTTLLSSLATANGCLPVMAQVGLPTLISTLQAGSMRDVNAPQSILLEGTLDLLCSFVSETDRGVAQQIYTHCAQPTCELLLHSGEDNIIQSACELFRKLLLVGGEQFLHWAPQGPSHSLNMLVVVLSFVLNPNNSDGAAMFVPGLALQSLLSLPSAAHELAPKLLQMLVAKATCCEIEALRGMLFAVIARILVDQTLEAQLSLLSKCPLPDSAGISSNVTTFLACWVDHVLDTRGGFPQQLCALVLAKLAACRHPSLNVQVLGKPQYDETVGVRTRRQKAALGSGVTRTLTALVSRLMHASVQLLHAVNDPHDASDSDWRNLLYGNLSDDDDEDDSELAQGFDVTGLENLGRTVDIDPAAVMTLTESGLDEPAEDLWKLDPLRDVNLGQAAVQELVSFMHGDRAQFDSALKELNTEEMNYLKAAFEEQGQGGSNSSS